MNYLESIAYLESLSPTLEKPTVERIKQFLAAHGDPQKQFTSFHVGGTNGKGSTVAILDSVLRECGLRVGRFTGPHLLRWNERFHVDGAPISDDDFALYATNVREHSEKFGQQNPEIGKLTWFEFITALMFFYFRDRKIDTAVLEVGLGGRFDATNVLGDELLCSIITNISLDHTHILGGTEELIAFEKAGIIQPGKPVVTGATGGALDVIEKRAKEINAPLITLTASNDFAVFDNGAENVLKDAVDFRHQNPAFNLPDLLKEALKESKFDEARGPLMGEHQHRNALLAFAALYLASDRLPGANHASNALANAWARGVRTVYWPGRMQRVSEQIVLDGAHNPGGARALRSALNSHYPSKHMLFVLSCFDNKDAGGILQSLVNPGDRVFLCEAATRRATFPKAKLLEMADEMGAKPEIFNSIGEAYRAAVALASVDDIVVATGSFATVRECMQEIGWQSVEDGRDKSGKIDASWTARW